MAITNLTDSGVYQFSTVRGSSDSIRYVTGTDNPFARKYYNGITLYTNSGDAFNTANNTTIDNYGIIYNRGLYQYEMGASRLVLPYINADAVVTSSVSNSTKLLATGSLYVISGSANHYFELPSSTDIDVIGSVIKIFKNSSTTNKLIISVNGASKINNALEVSSTSPYASVELLALHSNPGWAIVSSVGTWT